MPVRAQLQTVEVTGAGGRKTKFRVRADQVDKYRRMSESSEPPAEQRDVRTRSREPRRRQLTGGADVETKAP